VEEVTRKKNKVVVIVEWGEDCAIQVMESRYSWEPTIT
jgi:hypothetical protein